MKMTMWLVVMVVVVLAIGLWAGGAQAAGIIGIPIEGMDVSYTVYNPIGEGDSLTLPTLTLHPYKDTGPATPTTLDNLDDWAKSNLGLEIPFEGDAHTLLRPRGIGVSEAAQITTIQSVPIRAGVAWITGAGMCLFIRAEAISF